MWIESATSFMVSIQRPNNSHLIAATASSDGCGRSQHGGCCRRAGTNQIESFAAGAAAKASLFDAVTVISAPVDGLRSMRQGLPFTLNEPSAGAILSRTTSQEIRRGSPRAQHSWKVCRNVMRIPGAGYRRSALAE